MKRHCATVAEEGRRSVSKAVWRRVLYVGLIFAAIIAAVLFVSHAARFLDVSTPPRPADYAFVVPGEENTRPFVAALLYRRGLVPKILVAENLKDSTQQTGMLPSTGRVIVEVLQRRGVPSKDILPLGGATASTWDDLAILSQFLKQNPGATVLVITSSFHTRRCRWVLRQQLGAEASRVHLVAAPLEWYDGVSWWHDRVVATAVAMEYLKLVYYWLRYGPGVGLSIGGVIVLALVWLSRRIIRKGRCIQMEGEHGARALPASCG